MASNGSALKRYVIVRQIPSIGSETAEGLGLACQKSNSTIASLQHNVQWVHSYVVADKTYCIYLAPSEEAIKKHAEVSGFPANSIEEVKAIIDPISGYGAGIAR